MVSVAPLLMDFHCQLSAPSCLTYWSIVLSLPADNPDKSELAYHLASESSIFVQCLSRSCLLLNLEVYPTVVMLLLSLPDHL